MRPDVTLPGLLRDAAVAVPERVAVAVDGADRLTFGAWDRRSGGLAAGLDAAGVLPGDRVAMVYDAARWCDYAVAYLALHKVGAVPVLLPAGSGALALDGALRDHRPSAVVAPEDLAPAGCLAPVLDPRHLEALGRDRRSPRPPASRHPAEILVVLRPLVRPEAVPRSRHDLFAALDVTGVAPASPSVLLHSFAPGSVPGQDALCAALAASTTIVLPVFDPARFCDLAGGGVRTCALHPAGARALLESGVAADSGLAGVERVVLTSGGVSPDLLMAVSRSFPGASLATVDVLGHGPATRTVLEHDRQRPGALGRPAGQTVVWVDDGTGRPARTGTPGRLRVGAAAPDGQHTDDVGFIDEDGVLSVAAPHDIIGRLGSPVTKGEVETALREHPAVVDSAALGVPDDRSATALLAAVVVHASVPAQELQAWVGERLGAARAPDEVVVLDALPRNQAGALLAGALRRRLELAPPAPEHDRDPGAGEKAVIAIWRRVLGRPEIGVDDDFFELGGTPFAARGALDLLEDATGVRLPLGAFMQAPTVSGVAAEVAAVERRASTAGAGPTPVAFSQEGMVWHEHFTPGCQNLPGLARRYRGPLDVEALERALDEIVRRHEALRSNVALHRGRLVQTIRAHEPTRLPIHDLGDLPADEREEEVARRVAEAGQRPFDLTRDAVFAADLLRLAADDHVLVIRTHHSVFDDWSVGVFRRELAAHYRRFAGGEAAPLPEPVAFTDFVRGQRRSLAGPAGTREMAFWRRELRGAPLTTQLPVDDPARPQGAPQTAGQPVALTVPAELHAGLQALAREHRSTVFMTMLAAYAVAVQRYTGQDDLLLATVVANRNRTELEGVIGCFTKKVPLRLRLDGDPSFVELLARTRTALLGALTHQDLPFEAVVQDVLGGAAAAHGLVPHVVLMFQGETPRAELTLPGLDTSGFQTATTARRAHFMADDDRPPADLDDAVPWGAGLYRGTFVILSVSESDDELTCVARGAFHGPAVRQLLDAYRTLLADLVADPARPISRLRLAEAVAQGGAPARGGEPAAADPSAALHAAFDARAGRDPDAVAVRAGGHATTYAELQARADVLAGRLQALGVAPGTTVGIAVGADPEAVVAALAVWKAGAAWVGLDPGDGPERLAGILARTSARVVVGADRHGTIAPRAEVVDPDGGSAEQGRPTPVGVTPEDAAVVFFGAGQTAVPHGVVLDQRCLLALAANVGDLRGPARTVCLSAGPTDDAFVRQLCALLEGGTLWVPERPLTADPTCVVELVGAGHVDVLDCTPAEFRMLVRAGLAHALERRPTAAGEPVLVVGTRHGLDPKTWATARRLGRARTVVVYGPPECGFAATAAVPADTPRTVIGCPMTGVQAHVLDADAQPVAPQVRGELHIGGHGLARGVLDPPDDGGPRQGPPSFVGRGDGHAATRLWRAGYHARRLPDGTVELLGRVDADTDLRGFAVDPARITAALAGSPGVRDVVVSVHRDDPGGPRLVAHITPDGRPPTLAEVRARVWERLPGYACPSALVLVGDTDRRVAGDTSLPLAAAVTGLWADVLGAGRVAAGENYWQRFSFLEVLARAREAGLPVAGEHVTRNRTVEMLATDVATHAPPAVHEDG